MAYESSSSFPLWMEVEGKNYPKLRQNTVAEICIVGAGIAGLSVAYQLCRAGKKPIILDAGVIGGGQTGRTTAHLCDMMDDGYAELEKLHGTAVTPLIAGSHRQALQWIENVVCREKISCNFRRLSGYLFPAYFAHTDMLREELSAARRAGIKAEWLETSPIVPLMGPCVKFPYQATFHPQKYLLGLAEAVQRMGGRIYEHTHVLGVEKKERMSPALYTLTAEENLKISAEHVVMATNTPINDRFAIHTKQAAYRTYVIAAPVPSGTIPDVLMWDTDDPYHYVRLEKDPDYPEQQLLIIGGEDHKTGQGPSKAMSPYDELEKWGRSKFPELGVVSYAWSGQIYEPMDAVAFIGRNPGDEKLYVVTGDSGNGMTHGTVAGILITDLILGKDNPWEKIYHPGRFKISSIDKYLGENLNTAWQYSDWIVRGDLAQASKIPVGEGAVIRKGMHKIAVYRPSEKTLQACSATCPHLGGIVHWNPLEKTWDCPCHGSRFSPSGEVLQGPAITGLAKTPRDEMRGLKAS